MKSLLAIRHAKSDWNNPGLPDLDRPLNQRGLRDAPLMGERLRGKSLRPDVILTSTAARASATAQFIAAALSFPLDAMVRDPKIYLATAPTLLGIIQQIDDEAQTALIFGHNPGMHEFACQMLRADQGPICDFPTLAVAWLELPVEHWAEAEWGSAKLIELLTPR